MKIAVIGGGVSGLAAAWEIRNEAEVTVFEAGRFGGKILTADFDGRPVDGGADSFLTRLPDATALCSELGIDDLVAPVAGQTLLWHRSRLHRMPQGLVLGVPRQLVGIATSRLLSPAGLARAAADLVLPTTSYPADLSVRELVASRFGNEVADVLVDPLVGGIHAGTIDTLSAESTVPEILAVARRSRSLLLGLRHLTPDPSRSPFLAPRGGMGVLVDRLTARLMSAGVQLARLTTSGVRPSGHQVVVDPPGESFDAVVMAVPAKQAADLLGEFAPPGLSDITAQSVALALLGYAHLDLPEGVNGILVGRGEGRLMTACSFGSSKWPHWARPGRSVLRVSAGRQGDQGAFALDDADLVARLTEEVEAALGVGRQPDIWHVYRWPASFPQYRVGHLELCKRIDDHLRRTLPGLILCGASYHGTGVPACIASGRAAARRVLAESRRRQ